MTSPLRTESLNPLDQHRLDFAKDAFKSSLHSGRQPRIEDFLPFVLEELQAALLPELLLVEFSFRRVAGDSVTSAEYVTRFPEHSEMISKLLEQSAASGSAPNSGPKVETARDGQTLLVGGKHERSKTVEQPSAGNPQALPEQFGRYRIERELGRGGMGVYISRTMGNWIGRLR